jgi:capsid protein
MYEIYMRHQIRMIAASLGLLYEQLSGDFSDVNDRTWRAAVSEFRRRCEAWQYNILVYQFCRPVAKRWAELAVLSGAARGLDPTTPVQWTPQRWAYINPVQEGFTSRRRIVSERGDDVEQIDAEQKADADRADKMGLKHTSDGRFAIKGAAPSASIGHNGGPPIEDEDGPAPGGQQPQEQ